MSHPNLVSIYDVEETEDGDLVIVMEYVEGETLRDAVAREGRLSATEALRILAGAAAGIDAIHAQGIVHRDVKPANVLLGINGDVKVADLGIAAVADRTQITTSGSILGSLSYMAPEQMRDGEATPAIDIYALAAVAYEALSGHKARREPNPVALAYAMDNKPPPDLRETWPEAPGAAAEVLELAMDRDPRRRPRSAGELVARLRTALESPPTAPASRPSRQLPPRRRPAPAAAAAAAADDPAAAPATSGPAATTAASRRRRSGTALPIALLVLVAAAVIVAVALASSHSTPPRPKATAHHQAGASRPTGASTSSHTPTSSSASGSASTSTPTTSASAATPAPAAGAPGDTAKSFYTLAAAHRYPQAWALADPSFQSQLGGYQSFQSTFAGDRSITVDSLRTLSTSAGAATVAITTTSVRTDGTQHCSGTVQLASGAAKPHWLMHHIQINCQ